MNLNPQTERNIRRGRFAPSPSGRFHVGNIFSSMVASLVADEMILRIEDLDPDRSKQKFIDQVMRDFDWFGFEWVGEVLYQSSSDRQDAYQAALSSLKRNGLIYPCFCSRADLHSASAPHVGEEFVYQNTCKCLSQEDRAIRALKRNPSLRFDVAKIDHGESFNDLFQGEQCYDLSTSSGDFIVRRSDGVFAYQLAVVVDDTYSEVNSVVRGVDLLSSTPKQLALQETLGYSTPQYGHVPIFIDEAGCKLSKRNADASLEYLIDVLKMTAQEILGYLAFLSGIIPEFQPLSLADLKHYANLDALEMKRQIVWSAPLEGQVNP